MDRPDKRIEAPPEFQLVAEEHRHATDASPLLMPLLRPIRALLILSSSLLNLTPMRRPLRSPCFLLLLLGRHLLRVLWGLRLGRLVLPRWTIRGLLRLIALLIGLFLLLGRLRLTIGLVRLVVGRLLLWRLVIRRLLLRRLLPLLPRITHVPHRIPVRARTLGHCPDDKKGQGNDEYDDEDREYDMENKPGQGEAEWEDDRKRYWDDMREKPNPSATVWRISIVHF